MGLVTVELVLFGRSDVGELYEACLREVLRTTDGGTVEAADIDSIEGICYGSELIREEPVAQRLELFRADA